MKRSTTQLFQRPNHPEKQWWSPGTHSNRYVGTYAFCLHSKCNILTLHVCSSFYAIWHKFFFNLSHLEMMLLTRILSHQVQVISKAIETSKWMKLRQWGNTCDQIWGWGSDDHFLSHCWGYNPTLIKGSGHHTLLPTICYNWLWQFLLLLIDSSVGVGVNRNPEGRLKVSGTISSTLA